MKKDFGVGDRVLCVDSGVVGEVLYFYTPTSCDEQTMVLTEDGRKYHAPTIEWVKYDGIYCPISFSNIKQISINTNGPNIIEVSNRAMEATSDEIKRIRDSNFVKLINGRLYYE